MHGILTDIGNDIRSYLDCPGEFVPQPTPVTKSKKKKKAPVEECQVELA